MACRSREPPPRSRAPAPTTIHDLGEDLILEIFLRLPYLPSLVRAAFACRAFLTAVRSSPAFRRRFRALHGPPVLGVFLGRDVTDVRSYVPLRRQSDPGFSAAARGSDFFVNHVPDFLAGARWHVVACRGGFVLLFDGSTKKIAAYNPLTGALDLFPAPPAGGGELACHGYHMVPCDRDDPPGSFRVVSLFRDGPQLRAAVFSSATRAWQILPWTGEAPAQQLVRRHKLLTGPQVEGRVYWTHPRRAYCIVLDTTTLQFSSIDLPAHLKGQGHKYRTGQTKDGKLCIVHAHAMEFMISIWLQTTDSGGADQWRLDCVIPLEGEIFKVTKGSLAEHSSLQVWMILDGLVYLSTSETSGGGIKPCWFLSFCLETRKLEKLFCKTAYNDFYPYIMAWPPSLLGNN